LLGGVKPDFTLADACDSRGEPLLRTEIDHRRCLGLILRWSSMRLISSSLGSNQVVAREVWPNLIQLYSVT
jgi:hypothetical protein